MVPPLQVGERRDRENIRCEVTLIAAQRDKNDFFICLITVGESHSPTVLHKGGYAKVGAEVKTELRCEFGYQLLGRLQQDCEYVLGLVENNTSLRGTQKALWALEADMQIEKMRELHEAFPEDAKPEWCTLEDISEYERRFKAVQEKEAL